VTAAISFPQPDARRARAYRAAGYWRDDTIPGLFAGVAALAPDKIAVRDASGASVTYSKLDRTAASIAGFLLGAGVGKGDIVTVCLPNWWQAVAVILGAMRIGAVLNPVPTTYGRADLAYVLGKCRSKALFVSGRFRGVEYAPVVAALDLQISVVQVGDANERFGIPFAQIITGEPARETFDLSADDPAAVLFTSGTEAKPKGAVHTHNTILFGERAMASALGIGPSDIAFMASPISHATGFLHGVVMTLTAGGTLSLLDVFSGSVAAEQMRDHRCTWTMGATPFLSDVSDALETSSSRLPDLRYFLCGGAPVPEVLVQRATNIGLRILSIYGSTESPPHTIVHPDDPVANAWTTDGRPLAGIEIGIVSDVRHVLPLGEIGEERSRGPNTCLGYLDEPALLAKDFDADGWYYSGDLARQLPDGSIRIAGRLKDIIVRGGQNISAREIEEYLIAHPAVQAVAVVGVPHLRLGETSCAVVALKGDHALTLAELTAYLSGLGIARYKLPERLEIWPSLPTTPSGKIQKFLIRKILNEQHGKVSA
jgi:acyl-CoA synthetase